MAGYRQGGTNDVRARECTNRYVARLRRLCTLSVIVFSATSIVACGATPVISSPTKTETPHTIVDPETGVELLLAPEAAEIPPILSLNGEQVPWFALNWNSHELQQSIEPNVLEMDLPTISTTSVLVELTPLAVPTEFTVMVYSGDIASAIPIEEPYIAFDCLSEENPCSWTVSESSVSLTIPNIREMPVQVVAIQARYFAPPDVNADRVMNEVGWLIKIDHALEQ